MRLFPVAQHLEVLFGVFAPTIGESLAGERIGGPCI
jgi:hypothetical protein